VHELRRIEVNELPVTPTFENIGLLYLTAATPSWPLAYDITATELYEKARPRRRAADARYAGATRVAHFNHPGAATGFFATR
jgi:hypothetical protein